MFLLTLSRTHVFASYAFNLTHVFASYARRWAKRWGWWWARWARGGSGGGDWREEEVELVGEVGEGRNGGGDWRKVRPPPGVGTLTVKDIVGR